MTKKQKIVVVLSVTEKHLFKLIRCWLTCFGEHMARRNEDVAELLIEGIEDVIENISKNFMFSNKLDETSLSEDFMDDLLLTLETARTELVNAFY